MAVIFIIFFSCFFFMGHFMVPVLPPNPNPQREVNITKVNGSFGLVVDWNEIEEVFTVNVANVSSPNKIDKS